ncbi:MAG: dynamin family protein [Gammaproteobacteria bacterium]|nr:dynamin family protein [Gammaproteobacteria bacterium]
MTTQILNTEIEQYSAWRERVRGAVQELSRFLKDHNITDLRTHHQFETVLGSLVDDNLSVAFVAEFSRGKSEMINTIFFGNYKRRVLPSGSGRTTMCPTELLYDPDKPASIRLLPIESRQDERPLFQLKADEELWQEIEFDPDNSDSVAAALKGMTDNKLVSKNYAKKLNFDLLENDNSEIGLPVNKFDEVEIPSWRHAVINLPHPLLEMGLVILDTPGLNAIGAEPELTINQLSTAHTVIFILSHDTGVTSTDLELWETHLDGVSHKKKSAKGQGEDATNQLKLVALNKIDALWDGIRSDAQIESEIEAQVTATSKALKLERENIFPVSAQKGLLAKMENDPELFKRSNIGALEQAIADRLIPEKRTIVVSKVRSSLESILESASSIMGGRLKDADEHIAELRQLSSKNTDVISHIMLKVQAEKSALETDMQRYQALRAVYAKETKKLAKTLSEEKLEKLIAITKHNMTKCATSVTLQKTISKYFEHLNTYLDSAITQANEIANLSENITRDFEKGHGIANFKMRRLRLERYKQDVARLEAKHANLKKTRTLFFKEQMSITNKFYESVCSASRKIFSRALRDANNWNNNLMVPMETHVREHHTQLRRRLESVKRIHRASDTVEARLEELNIQQGTLVKQSDKLKFLQKTLEDILAEGEKVAQKTQEAAKKKVEKESAEVLYWDRKTNF